MTVVLSVLALMVAGMTFALLPASAEASSVCAPLSSGKIDVTGSYKSLTIVAPEGMLVSGYCVKAGSTQQGNGPEYVTVNPAMASVTIAHSSGKDISHWSATYTPMPVYTGVKTV
ncbi:MAG TPA: hypothetical protein DCQ36_10035, partial [Actinobacteria bacterium]|nr:hypothetical protein [Actinomycetota bacterium]